MNQQNQPDNHETDPKKDPSGHPLNSNQQGNDTNAELQAQPKSTDQPDQQKMKKTDSVDIKREEILETDALKDISQIKEDDRKFDERLLESPEHSNIQYATQDTNPEAIIEKLKKKCIAQKKIISELEGKLQEGQKRELRLREGIEQASPNKNENLKRETERLRVQNNTLQKELVAITQKYKGVVGFRTSDRAAKLENLLKQRDRDIENLLMEKRYFEKVKREQDKAIGALKQDRDYLAKMAHDYGEEIQNIKKNHIGSYREDLIVMRNHIQECQKRIKEDEKIIRKQSQIITTLDIRQKELCDKMGVTLNPLLDQQTREDLLKFMKYNQKHYLRSSKNIGKNAPPEDTWADPPESSEEEDLTRSNIPLAEKLSRTHAKYISLKKSYQLSEKRLKSEVEFLVSRLNDVEIQLREKEKENLMLSERIAELRMRRQILSPINRLTDESTNLSGIKQDKKMLLSNFGQSPELQLPIISNKLAPEGASLFKTSDSASSLAQLNKNQGETKKRAVKAEEDENEEEGEDEQEENEEGEGQENEEEENNDGEEDQGDDQEEEPEENQGDDPDENQDENDEQGNEIDGEGEEEGEGEFEGEGEGEGEGGNNDLDDNAEEEEEHQE